MTALFRLIILTVSAGCFFLFPAKEAVAQLQLDDNYNREFSMGLMVHPKGAGLDFRYGRYLPSGRVEYLEFEVLNIRHPKEIRIYNTGITNSNPYTFGKQNLVLAARLGYGNKFLLAEKKLKNTASISFNVAVGPTIAFLKPIYLDLLLTDVNNNDLIVSTKVTPEANINQNDIIGNSAIVKGMNEVTPRLGAFAKAGFNFDWGDFTDEIKAIEVGVYVDAFPQRLPIMLNVQNKYLFPSFYICAVFGNKW